MFFFHRMLSALTGPGPDRQTPGPQGLPRNCCKMMDIGLVYGKFYNILQETSILNPIGSMYGIYANMTGVCKWQMLPYMAYMDPMGMVKNHGFR